MNDIERILLVTKLECRACGQRYFGLEHNLASATAGNFCRPRSIIVTARGKCVCRWRMLDALVNIAVYGFGVYGHAGKGLGDPSGDSTVEDA